MICDRKFSGARVPPNMNGPTKTDSSTLKQRLAGLSADQRARLIRQLGEKKSEAAFSSAANGIRKAKPLRVEANPPVAVYPASQGQQRMWFLHHYAQAMPVYCVPSAFRLTGPLNGARLATAFGAVIRRHAMLRTTFAMENGELFQRVAAASGFRLQQINLEAVPADARQVEAEKCLNAEAGRSFDLSAEPAMRATLVRLQPDDHVLLLVLHHIISDGWSRSNFYRELAAAYTAQAAGQPAVAQELPVQFADYSAWQAAGRAGGTLATQTDYWKHQLAGEPPPLNLPSDRPRRATESFRGGRCARRLEAALTTALKTRAQEEGATLFMILLAAFKTLLHRYTGQDDLIVGVPIAGRQRAEVEPLIGFFANTLALRTTFTDGLTFRELLRRVQETAVAAYANQDLPFEQLVEELQVRRDAGRTPLFQTTFTMQDFPATEFPLPEIQSAPWPVTTHTSKFDFSLTLERSDADWTATAEYSTDLFAAGRMERMLDHWRVILESVAANPAQKISEIPLLTAAERRQLLVEWNNPASDFPPARCLHEIFAAQAERTPDAIALTGEGARLTYRELNARANQLAHWLRAGGVGPEVIVGLYLDRSPEMVVGILGILKAGGAYLPIDHSPPKARLAFMLADAPASVLLTQQKLLGELPAHHAKVFCLDDPQSAAQPATNPDTKTAPTNLAYVIYTSGSTGQPKGCAVTHHNVVRLMSATAPWFHFNERDVWTLFHSCAFDFSVWEIWGALCFGGRLVVVPYLVSRSPEAFYELLATEKVTVLNQTPGAFRQLIQAEQNSPRELALRGVIFGGEALEMQMLKPWFARHGDQRPQLVNMYGLTETTVHVTYRPLTKDDVQAASVIGIPIPDLQIFILDKNRQLVPIGVPGELFVGGAGLARGYLNRPELTAARFIPHPFSGEPGARLYRTGDLARFLPNRDIEYLGRIDQQVKIRGFRIELGEIESVLAEHPAVRQAVVLARADGLDDRRLVAYVVPANASFADPEPLRVFLSGRLPDYMRPAAYVLLAHLPLTSNGKADHQALPAPEIKIRTTAAPAQPPLDRLEQELSRLWRQLFRREHIGRDDNFFELGGHSLMAVRLTSEIHKLVGWSVPVAALFQAPSIAALAAKLRKGNAHATMRSLVTLQPSGTELPLFCIHGIYGDVFGFRHLARALAPDRPVYGLQAVGLFGSQPRHTTVEQMAAHYADAIIAHQPQGPFHLAGYSLGGWNAYAVAQELKRRGHKVGLLAMIDTRATSDVPWSVYYRVMAPYLAHRARFHLGQFLNGQHNGRLPYLKQKLNWFRLYATRTRVNLPVRPVSENAPPFQAQDLLNDYFDAIVRRYRPPKYAGDVTVFAGDDAKFFNHRAFWKHFVRGRVQFKQVAGSHGALIGEDLAAKFAETCRQGLREAETAPGK